MQRPPTAAPIPRQPVPHAFWFAAAIAMSAMSAPLVSPLHAEALFTQSSSFETGANPVAVAAGDFNRDGRTDLAVADRGSSSVSILLALAGGGFAPKFDLPCGGAPQSVAVADLDADGRVDVVLANGGGNTVSVLIGNGDGTFRPRLDVAAGIGVRRVVVADLNGDGHADIAALNEATNTISVLHGNGDGTFPSRAQYPTGISPSALAAADLNADGRADLVAVNLFGVPGSVLLSRPDGTLAPRLEVKFMSLNPASVAISDMNGDGRPDLVVASLGFDAVTVLHGNGDGTFVPAAEFGTGLGPASVVAADLDGDGRSDLAVSNIHSSSVIVQRQTAVGVYESDPELFGGEYPSALIAADMNGDGRLDLVSANNASNNVTVYTSRTPQVPMRFWLARDRVELHGGDDRIAAFLQPPAPFAAADIEVSSIRINGSVAVDLRAGISIRDRDHDGIAELRVRLDRRALNRMLPAAGDAILTVTGTIAGREFVGSDTVRVRRHEHGSAPVAESDDAVPGGWMRAAESPAVRMAIANPVPRGGFALELSLPAGRVATLQLLDVAGRSVASRRIESLGGGARRIEWPEASQLQPGMYFLRLDLGPDGILTRRVVLE